MSLPLDVDYATVTGDVLYGIELRPQELSLFGENLQFSLRYSPIFDDSEAMQREHYKIIVLECFQTLPPDMEVGREQAVDLCLLKVGWQLGLETDQAIKAAEIGESPDEVPYLLGRIAETVNDLAQRAGVEIPLAEGVVEHLVSQYRSHHGSA